MVTHNENTWTKYNSEQGKWAKYNSERTTSVNIGSERNTTVKELQLCSGRSLGEPPSPCFISNGRLPIQIQRVWYNSSDPRLPVQRLQVYKTRSKNFFSSKFFPQQRRAVLVLNVKAFKTKKWWVGWRAVKISIKRKAASRRLKK